MPRVDRPAVKACLFTEARDLLRLLRAIMARLAQRLQGQAMEARRVAVVAFCMVCDRGRDGLAALKVEAAKRLFCQLRRPAFAPGGVGV